MATTPSSENDGVTSMAVRCARALMERHGLPRYRQSKWLADATGLSYSQAHRRMTGASAWTLEDLAHIGELFGETLAEVVTLGNADNAVPAVMKVGSTSLDCRLWLGEEVENPKPDSVVAVRTSSGWAAVCASEANQGTMYKVERLEAKPGAVTRKVVAVLDDDRDLTNAICAHLEDSGYDARPFYKIAELLSSVKVEHYDGYVVGWIVGESSTQKLIAALRADDAASPIVVLAAQVPDGEVDETEIAAAVSRHNLVFSEKPVRLQILSALLGRAFATN